MKHFGLIRFPGRCGILTILLLLLVPAFLTAQMPMEDIHSDVEYAGCTSIMVAKNASTDGSVITCHSCDGNYRTWLNIEPAAEHNLGERKPVYWGLLHTESLWDMLNLNKKGEIPEVENTYAFMNVAYPCMNEKGLAIGETTIGGRRDLVNRDGLFRIENLQQIVLERCTTAREAIKLIGELAKEYGYGDSGECLTFADANEVWHFEIMGAGPFEIGAVWAAVRIPDDHVGVSANIPRISTLDLDNPDYYMASDNVFSLAEEMGWYDPSSGEEFKFWKAYNGRRPYSIREFYVLSTMAPSLNLSLDMEELPFSVKPDEKVSVQRVTGYYRETYEGTEYDMTKDLKVVSRGYDRDAAGNRIMRIDTVKSPLADNWMRGDMRNLLNAVKPGMIERQRTIAIAGCSYSQVIQCRGWLPPEVGTVAWFSFDNPGQSPRIPIFAGTLYVPKSFEICAQKRFRTDSAAWWFRRANRLSQLAWQSTRETIEGEVLAFEERAIGDMPMIEQRFIELNRTDPMKAREYLTKYTNDFAHAAMSKWWELGDTFWGRFARGF